MVDLDSFFLVFSSDFSVPIVMERKEKDFVDEKRLSQSDNPNLMTLNLI